MPFDVAFDSSGNVYVADSNNNRIQKFDSNGAFLSKWGSPGTADGQFSMIYGFAVDSSGNVYVADGFNNRIQKFDSSGAFLTKWGSEGTADGQFAMPVGVAVDSSGNVYVADMGNNRIQKFDSSGAFLTKWGSAGSEDGQFGMPAGVDVDSSGNVYVADMGNNRIQKFAVETVKTIPAITWNNPADITAGTALGSEQLNAVAKDPVTGATVEGAFVYTPAEGTILSAGTQTLKVDFTPSTANYDKASKEVTINVLKAIPTITWSNPADITAGTALSNVQLNAVASVTGTFVYTPPEGTVMNAGTQTLKVDFTPDDAVNYNIASKEVTINVLAPAPTINSVVVPIDPVTVNTAITASVDITYLGDLNALTAEWDWGDGSISQAQASPNFAASHAYNSAGIYTITFTVKNNNEVVATQKASDYVVVYDPEGGFVTGGGWINSPAGAYVPDNTLAGKATFGFVSKYKEGANVPTGNTEFQFKVANLNFKSTSYDWLVVAGPQAKYKGTGTLNGNGNYGFMLNSVDGAIKGDNIDRFRIKIWDKESGNAIYDNEIGTGEDAEPSTAISGGSIIIHKVT